MCFHELDTCPDHQHVLLPDFQQESSCSSSGSPAAACLCKGCTGLDTEAPETPLSASAIKAHQACRNAAYKCELRSTVQAAQQELLEIGWAAVIQAPIMGTGPLGAFSIYHLLVIEFVLSLPPLGSHQHTTGSHTRVNFSIPLPPSLSLSLGLSEGNIGFCHAVQHCQILPLSC